MMPARKHTLALVLSLAAVGCAESHGCPEGDGPYGFSGCTPHGALTPEEEEAFCRWRTEQFADLEDVFCGSYTTVCPDYEFCLMAESDIPPDCNDPMWHAEECVQVFIETPCDRAATDACLVDGCLADPRP